MSKNIQIVKYVQKCPNSANFVYYEEKINQLAQFRISRFQSCFKTHFLNMMHDNFYEYFVGAEKHEFQN